MSYGENLSDLARHTPKRLGKILKGPHPPVEHPIKFEVVINLTTARELRWRLAASFFPSC
jgi:putative tryptophan/tyrosine transport system substrate-binding protein